MPIFNESAMIRPGNYYTQPVNYQNVMAWIKRTPEAIGIIRAIVTDIMSDGYQFDAVQKTKGKDKIKTAEDFCKENFFKNEMTATLYDWLLLGNGALWKGGVSQTQVMEVLERYNQKFNVEFKEVEFKDYLDEWIYTPKRLRHVAWSTTNIFLTEDKTSIKNYTQRVAGERVITFSPEEIIHGIFMSLDGKVYGYSPMEANMSIISTLGLIKDMNGYFFDNGGVPDWMFILPKEQAGSPNVKALKEQLSKFKITAQRHGNLVITGEVDPKQLNEFNKDMEFRQLAIYYTGILAFSFNMPMSRVAAIIGAEVKQGAGSDDLSDSGYWRSISESQDYWETLLNTQLFEPHFGVKIRFNRGYKQDEMREMQIKMSKLDIAQKLINANIVTNDFVYKFLDIHPDDRAEGKIEFEFNPFQGGPNQPPGQIPGQATQAKSKKKKDEQNSREDKSVILGKEMMIKELNSDVII